MQLFNNLLESSHRYTRAAAAACIFRRTTRQIIIPDLCRFCTGVSDEQLQKLLTVFTAGSDP